MAEVEATLDDPTQQRRSGDRLARGQQVERYQVLECLGRGGMSEVYAAYDPRLDRSIALKIMKVERGEEAHSRLEREGRALARLGHRNVALVHDVGRFGAEWFVAMEHVQGVPLSRWIEDEHPWSETVSLFIQAAEGLCAAHDAGIIHRDFKPANVMVERETQRVVVLDFGLARVDPDEQRSAELPIMTGSGESTHSAVGTPGYMAPELLHGDRATPASDQFAFFISLYEALYGERPFGGRHVFELIESIEAGLKTPEDRRGVPGWLLTAIERGLHAKPTERHDSMAQVLELLRRGIAPPRRTGWALAGGAVLLLGGAAWWSSQSVDPLTACLEPRTAALTEIWDERRHAPLSEAMVASGRPHADETAPRVLTHLDRFAQAWTETATHHCKAQAHGTQARTAATDACLDDRLTQLRVTVAELSGAREEPGVADHALELALALPRPAACLDEPTTSDPSSTHAADVVEAVARSAAMRVLGRSADALTHADQAVSTGRQSHDPRALADAYVERGRVRDSTARYDEALSDYAAALATATEHDLVRRQATASMELLRVVGDRQRGFDEAERWRVLAEAATTHLPDDDELRAQLAWISGTVTWRAGKLEAAQSHLEDALARFDGHAGYDERIAGILTELSMVVDQRGQSDEARAHVERAVAMRTELFGPDHPAVADALADQAVIAGRGGDPKRALKLGQRALEIYERGVDASHPHVATIVMNMGLERRNLGEHAEAVALFDRAVALRTEKFGDDHQLVANARGNRATSLAPLGRVEEAERDLRAAIDILTEQLGPMHPDLMSPLTNLGNLVSDRNDLAAAVDLHTRAHEIAVTTMAPDHPAVGIGVQNLGDLWARRGDCTKAETYFRRALAIFEKSRGPQSTEAAYPLMSLGECALTRGEPTAAIEVLRRADEIRRTAVVDPADRGMTALTLARALFEADAQDTEAVQVARRALVALDRAGPGSEGLRSQAEAWVRETWGTSEFPITVSW
ncbi:MAG: serine/threonine-protein kinase [Myxococcota bacterium]